MSLTPPIKVGKLQAALHDRAKRAPSYRFYALYDKVWRDDVLRHAWERCRANDGAPGVDRQSFEQIERAGLETWLGELSRQLREKRYRPDAVRRVMIPKADGKQRPLGIPIIKDRVVQMAAAIVLEPIFEADLPHEQFGYRPERRAHDAVNLIHAWLQRGMTEVVDADLSGYFDTIPHPELMQCLARRISDPAMLALLKSWLEMPVEQTDERGHKQRTTENKDTRKGTPQGSPISPLLSNLYLRRFVLAWKKFKTQREFGTQVVVYADDFVILCRHSGQKAREQMEELMSRIKLKVNTEKTKVCRVPEESFDFLGYTFGRCFKVKTGQEYIGTKPSPKRVARFCASISEMTETHSLWMPVEMMVEQLNARLRGWGNYFCLGSVGGAYRDVDNHARQRLRQWLNRKHASQNRSPRRYGLTYLHLTLGLYRLSNPTHFSWAKS